MTTRLTMICQGSTVAVRAPAFPQDDPLDEAEWARLSNLGVSQGCTARCWTSPARCARQTAEALGLFSAVAPELRDCDYGRWAGRSFEDVRRKEPEALADWLADLRSTPHGGESLFALSERVAAWLDLQRSGTGEIVVTTHACVIRAALIHAIGAPSAAFWRIDVAPLSMMKLSGLAGRWTLSRLGPIPDGKAAEGLSGNYRIETLHPP